MDLNQTRPAAAALDSLPLPPAHSVCAGYPRERAWRARLRASVVAGLEPFVVDRHFGLEFDPAIEVHRQERGRRLAIVRAVRETAALRLRRSLEAACNRRG